MAIPRESQVVLGTVVIHAIIIGVMAIATEVADDERAPTPTLRMVKLDTRRPPPPPPPPEPPPEPPAVTPPPTAPPPTTARRSEPRRVATTTTPPPTAEPPPTTTTPAPGGAPVVTLPGVAPAARGVAVRSGTPTDRRTGQGGTGGGTGAGSGSGSGPPVAKVVSVASIKKLAQPKGDYDYFDAKKQYPAEARQLGVGGVVRVQLTIDAQGKVVKVRLLGKGLGHGLDELALTRARTLQFEPALDTDDRPVASVLTWTFRFEVPT